MNLPALYLEREVHLLQRLEQAPDHAESLAFAEGHYLKGLLCRVS